MHHPVSHPLTDHAHAQERRQQAVDAMIEEAERATAQALDDLGDALSNLFAHTGRCVSDAGASRGMRQGASSIDRVSRRLSQTTGGLLGELVVPGHGAGTT